MSVKRACKYILFLLLNACSKGGNVPEATPAVRTAMVYMAADNDLWADALADVEELQAEFSEQRSLVKNKEQHTSAGSGARKPPTTAAARQGEAPEVQPRGSALPP
jgi:hypothetical protein